MSARRSSGRCGRRQVGALLLACPRSYDHAVVLGASMAGLLTAQALSATLPG